MINRKRSTKTKNANNQQNIDEKLLQIWNRNIKGQNKKIGFGRVVGSIWEGFWKLLGASWADWAPLGRFLGRSKSNFCTALGRDGLQDGLQVSIWMALGQMWQGFGLIWGGFWRRFERCISIMTSVLACVRTTARHSYSRRVFLVKIGFRAENFFSR